MIQLRIHLLALVFIIAPLASPKHLRAELVNGVPTELQPGDEYRLVFASSSRHRANFRNLAQYDQILDPLGDLVIASDWKILGASSESPNARTRTGTDSSAEVPIFRMDGQRVASSYGDFWDGSLLRPIQFDQNGRDLGRDFVWTGMSEFGTYTGDGLGDRFVRSGLTNSTDRRWTRDGFDLNGSRNRFYGISGVLTVPAVPEPSNVLILVSLAGSNAILRRKRSPTD